MHLNKATGPDVVQGRLLKTQSYELVDFICTIVQASPDQGITPKV